MQNSLITQYNNNRAVRGSGGFTASLFQDPSDLPLLRMTTGDSREQGQHEKGADMLAFLAYTPPI